MKRSDAGSWQQGLPSLADKRMAEMGQNLPVAVRQLLGRRRQGLGDAQSGLKTTSTEFPPGTLGNQPLVRYRTQPDVHGLG